MHPMRLFLRLLLSILIGGYAPIAEAFPRGATGSIRTMTVVQQAVVNNTAATTIGANFWLDKGQVFAPCQVLSGDSVVWKTNSGTTIPSQMDDGVWYPAGFNGCATKSLKFAAFTLRYPSALTAGQIDTPKAYDNPGVPPPTPTCFGNFTTWLLSHDYRIEAGRPPNSFQGSLDAAGNLTVSGSVTGLAIAPSQPLYATGVGPTVTITGGSGLNWTTNYSGPALSLRVMGSGPPLIYTLSANNEQNNESSTHVIMYRLGANQCSAYIIGYFRQGTAFTDPVYAGQPFWGAMYIDWRSDGSSRIWSQIFDCSDQTSTGATPSSCPTMYLVNDGSGNVASTKDYSLGSPTLIGCDAAQCVLGGNASGNIYVIPSGSGMPLLDADGKAPDTATDSRRVVINYPLPKASDPTTRGLYDSATTLWYGYSDKEIGINGFTNGIVQNPYTAFDYHPGVCQPDTPSCNYNATGNWPYIGPISGYALRCWLAGSTPAAWTECDYDRKYSLIFPAMSFTFRNSNTGRQINLDNYVNPPGMNQDVFVGFGVSASIPNTGGPPLPTATAARSNASNHTPEWGAWQYWLTGERPFLNMMQDNGNSLISTQNPGFRNCLTVGNCLGSGNTYSAILSFQASQPRQQAWNQRDISDAEYFTPDYLVDGVTPNPEKTYFSDWVDGPHGWLAYQNDYQDPNGTYYTASQKALGWLWPGNTTSNFNTGGYAVNSTPAFVPHDPAYQDNYWSTIEAREVKRGRTHLNLTSNLMKEYFTKNWVGRMINGCIPVGLADYNMSVAANPYDTNPIGNYNQTWSNAYVGDPESLVNQARVFVSADTTAPPITQLQITFASAADQAKVFTNQVLLAGVSGYTLPNVVAASGFLRWVIPTESVITSITNVSGLTETINISGTGITNTVGSGTEPITAPQGTGYIAGNNLTILSVQSGTFLGGMYLFGTGGTTLATNTQINVVPITGPGTYPVNISQNVGSAGSPVTFQGMQFVSFVGWNGLPPTTGTVGLVPLIPPLGCSQSAIAPGTAFPTGGLQDNTGHIYIDGGNQNYVSYGLGGAISLADAGLPGASIIAAYGSSITPNYDAVGGAGAGPTVPWPWPSEDFSGLSYVVNPQQRIVTPAFTP